MAMLQVLEECNLWEGFPNGVHVLVVDMDTRSRGDIKAKLEERKYIVTTFERSKDALMALEDPKNSFQIALVEAAIGDGLDGFLIATTKNNIPTIMMSDTENKEAMLRGFALGAVEFLLKPLSDEKLKNVWQHAVRKALSFSEKAVRPEYLKLLNTTIESPENSPSVSDSDQNDVLTNDTEDADLTIEGYPNLDGNVITGCEKISAPSTPQQLILKPREGSSQVSSGSETQSNQATEMVSAEFSASSNSSVDEINKEIESFSTELRASQDSANVDALGTALDFDCCNKMEPDSVNFDDLCLGDGDLLSDIDIDPQMFADFWLKENGELDLYNLDNCELLEKDLAEEEALLLAEVSKAEKEQIIPNIPDITINSDFSHICDYNMKGEALPDNKKSNRSESVKISSKNAQGKRKVKVDWTPDLHRRFVQAVEQLGVDKAVPSRILELMGVNCLTRHNIASHLQKYRSHRKHLLAREVESASWSQRRQMYATTAGTRSRRELTSWVSNGGSSLIHPRPPIAYSPMQPAAPAPPFRPLHVWGHPTSDHSMVHMWQKPPLPAAPIAWPAGDVSFWQHQPPVCTDTWAHNAPAPGTPCYPQPLVRLPMAPFTGVPHFSPSVFNGDHSSPEDSNSAIHPLNIDVPVQLKPATVHPPKETVDAAIDEVLSNPWAPLPIGLKPVSLETVMTELQKRGISVVPPASTCLAR